MAILRTIEQNENCTQAVIADFLRVSPASVATSTKRLQKAGLITKTVDKENLRCKRLAITDEGRAALKNHMELFKEYDELVFRNFSDDDKTKFISYLTRLISEMSEIEGIDGEFSNPMDLSCLLFKKVESIQDDNRKEL